MNVDATANDAVGTSDNGGEVGDDTYPERCS